LRAAREGSGATSETVNFLPQQNTPWETRPTGARLAVPVLRGA